MDGIKIQARVYRGYAIAARKIGLAHQHYRPASATDPVGPASLLNALPASFNAEDMKYGRPNKYGKPTWFALVDGAQTAVGDYLIGPSGTFFIAEQQALLPILAVECNRIISVFRPQQMSGHGLQDYGGTTQQNQTLLMGGWSASILQGTKGEKSETNLPGDVRNPWWAILMPFFPGIVIRSDDILTDDLQRKYVVSSAELTDAGWRLTAMQAQT